MQKLCDYFVKTYLGLDDGFEGDFPRRLWNNSVESYNLKLKKFVGNSSPAIFKAVKTFQNEECNAALNFYRAEPAPPKHSSVVASEALFQQNKRMFQAGKSLSTLTFVKLQECMSSSIMPMWRLQK